MPGKTNNLTLRVIDSGSLADAYERGALLAADGNFSFQDAVALVKQTALYDEQLTTKGIAAQNGNQLAQDLATSALLVLQHRSKLLGSAYPFDIQPTLLTCNGSPYSFTYPFLMALSHTIDDRAGSGPTRLFERICTKAAASYIGGSAVHFGWPRKPSQTFMEALKSVLATVGEAQLRPEAPRGIYAKDGGLDIVAWRDFPDLRPSKLVALGQCAAGQNWTEKTKDLIYDIWARHWLAVRFHSDPIRMLFIPRLITDDHDWTYYCDEGGLVFDRYRIASHLEKVPLDLLPKVQKWTRLTLKAQKVV